ncbi:MAG TPA: hypothetical protein VF553_18260 [Pyrinomonadaceae bacterium]|jgi:hypothetical protein
MTETEENKVRAVVQQELLGIIGDAQQLLGPMKDPTGMAKKALEGLANVIRKRQPAEKPDGQ